MVVRGRVKNGTVILEEGAELPEGAEVHVFLHEGAAPPIPRGPSAAEIAAMFKTDKPAPDDATVKQWIDEHRMEKYGR